MQGQIQLSICDMTSISVYHDDAEEEVVAIPLIINTYEPDQTKPISTTTPKTRTRRRTRRKSVDQHKQVQDHDDYIDHLMGFVSLHQQRLGFHPMISIRR